MMHAGYRRSHRAWEIGAFGGRIDSLFDRHDAGSLIVNESNSRYFEPAPDRSWALGLDMAWRSGVGT